MIINTQDATSINRRLSSIGTLAQAVSPVSTAKEAIVEAHLDWTVTKEQNRSIRTGELINSYGIYRDDNNAFLGQVGRSFTPIQNVEQFDFADELVGNIDGAHYVAAGKAYAGEKVFVVAKLGEFDLGAKGDTHNAYLVVSDWKNSRGSCRAQVVILREVCQNGMAVWVPDTTMSFRHTKHVVNRMMTVAQATTTITDTLNATREKLTILTERTITRDTVLATLDRLFPETEAERKGRANARRLESQKLVLDLLANNDNDAFPSERNTAFAMLQAVTQSVDHHFAPKATEARSTMTVAERRANNALFGKGAEFKNYALEVILEETARNTSQPRSILDDVLDATIIK